MANRNFSLLAPRVQRQDLSQFVQANSGPDHLSISRVCRRVHNSVTRSSCQELSSAPAIGGTAVKGQLHGPATILRYPVSESITGNSICSALAFAFVGDSSRAESLAENLANRFPEDTLVQFNYLPSIRAQLAITRGNSSKAIEALQPAAPYELGISGLSGFSPTLYPAYLRGLAYLAAHQATEAAGEFQKILDHRGFVQNELIGALAHRGQTRALAMQSDFPKSRAAYQDFLTLGKNADANIPILKHAKSELAKLK